MTRVELIRIAVYNAMSEYIGEWMSASQEIHDFIMNEKNISYFYDNIEKIKEYRNLHKQF